VSIFTIHSNVVEDYRDFVRSFFIVADERAGDSHGLGVWFARACGLTRDELRYILEPAGVYGPDFPGETVCMLKEKKQAKYGEYRTRRLILAAWDRLAAGS
jgi:hypothetical protein